MHQSADPKRKAIALAHYVDDSGSHDDSKLVVMGGPVFLQKSSFTFHYDWDRILQNHGITRPIHMLEFNQYGYLGHLSHDQRRALFHDLIHLINTNKVYSLTAEVDNLEFQNFFPRSKYKGLIGAPPLALMWCMFHNSILSRNHNASGATAYIVGDSNSNIQIVDTHAFIRSYERRTKQAITGSLTFDSPKNVHALQAADMIAWANRKKKLGEPFEGGFEPLELLTRTVESETRPPMVHLHVRVSSARVEGLAKILGDPIRTKGRRVALLKALSEEE